LKKFGADGFVFGALTKDADVDSEVCAKLMEVADPLPCTFHRAFDYVAKPIKSLECINRLGFSRILTSGQKSSALEVIPIDIENCNRIQLFIKVL